MGGGGGGRDPLFMRGPTASGGQGLLGSGLGSGVIGGLPGLLDSAAARDLCHECGRAGPGDLDQTDGHFYCARCWEHFEVWRAGAAPKGKEMLLPSL